LSGTVPAEQPALVSQTTFAVSFENDTLVSSLIPDSSGAGTVQQILIE